VALNTINLTLKTKTKQKQKIKNQKATHGKKEE
jgi:hypothetical protein